MTVTQIRAALAAATSDEERAGLIDQLEQALRTPAEDPSPVEQLRSRLADVTSRREQLTGEFEQVTNSAVGEDGQAREFTAEEAERRGALRVQIDQLDEQRTSLEDQIRDAEQAERQQRMDAQLAQLRQDLGLADQRQHTGIQVTDEPRTYQRGNGHSYLLDLCLSRTALGQALGARSVRAAERLARHARENHVHALEADERISRLDESKRNSAMRSADGYFLKQMLEVHNQRDQDRGPIADRAISYRALSTSSTAGGEFVPPAYLTEEWIAYMRPGRVLADNQHHEDLPDGTMSINIPKVTGGASVATQGTQNAGVSMTDLQTAFVTFPVVTKAGQQVVSLQLLERSPVSFDEIVGRDLAKAYAQQVDVAVANGPGGGDVLGILNTAGVNVITWTQSTPTLKGLYGQIGLGKVAVADTLFLPATHQVMTPLLWEWISQQFDTSNRPIVVPSYNGPFNAVAVPADEATAEGVVGRRMQGLNTFEDYNLPQNLGAGANQDVLLGGAFDENWLYESPVTTRMLPQTYGAQLSMLLQLYGYIAFTAARYPNANFVITGTGMAQSNRTFNS